MSGRSPPTHLGKDTLLTSRSLATRALFRFSEPSHHSSGCLLVNTEESAGELRATGWLVIEPEIHHRFLECVDVVGRR